MIYSPDHNFLFLKNYKVGGTSLEVELSQVLPDSAVVTQITPSNILHKPRNCVGFYNHMPYVEIEKIVGENSLKNIESVVFVRNPFDSVLSHMYMSFAWSNIVKPSIIDIDNYFQNKGRLMRLTGSKSREIYTKNKKILANNLYKYEDGLDQINITLKKIGISEINITANEKMYKPKGLKPLDIFNQKHIDIICSDWDWELKEFGYKI